MVALDEDSLICDLAEVYHVFDWRSLPVQTAATLAMGLGPDSRIACKLSGIPVGLSTLIQAVMADALCILVWQNSKAGHEGRNKPRSLLQTLFNIEKKETQESFASAEDFQKWRSSLVRGDTDV